MRAVPYTSLGFYADETGYPSGGTWTDPDDHSSYDVVTLGSTTPAGAPAAIQPVTPDPYASTAYAPDPVPDNANADRAGWRVVLRAAIHRMDQRTGLGDDVQRGLQTHDRDRHVVGPGRTAPDSSGLDRVPGRSGKVQRPPRAVPSTTTPTTVVLTPNHRTSRRSPPRPQFQLSVSLDCVIVRPTADELRRRIVDRPGVHQRDELPEPRLQYHELHDHRTRPVDDLLRRGVRVRQLHVVGSIERALPDHTESVVELRPGTAHGDGRDNEEHDGNGPSEERQDERESHALVDDVGPVQRHVSSASGELVEPVRPGVAVRPDELGVRQLFGERRVGQREGLGHRRAFVHGVRRHDCADDRGCEDVQSLRFRSGVMLTRALRWRARRSSPVGSQQGFTVIELMIASAIMLTVLAMFFSTLVSLVHKRGPGATTREQRAERAVRARPAGSRDPHRPTRSSTCSPRIRATTATQSNSCSARLAARNRSCAGRTTRTPPRPTTSSSRASSWPPHLRTTRCSRRRGT